MKNWSIPFAVLSLVGLVISGVCSADDPNDDHLSPVDRRDKALNRYRSLLIKKLGVTPFDCGRIIDSASLGPEAVLSVWCEGNGGRQACRITSIEALENLWQRTNSMRDPASVEGVAIRRIDTNIPESTAKRIREIFLRMLQNVRPAAPLGAELVMSGYLDFAIQRSSDSPPLEGEILLPPRGPKTQALVNISDALWEYSKAAPANRPAVARKIDREATALLDQLK
jgi:hypothetical protein